MVKSKAQARANLSCMTQLTSSDPGRRIRMETGFVKIQGVKKKKKIQGVKTCKGLRTA
jgi:hypothetical protein